MLQFFLLGVLAALASLILELLLLTPSSFPDFSQKIVSAGFWFIIGASIIEEIVKFSLIGKLATGDTHTNRLPLHAFALGLGFFSVEAFFIFFRLGTFPAILMGNLTIHLTTATLTGYFFAKYLRMNYFQYFLILLVNILLHLTYNILIATNIF